MSANAMSASGLQLQPVPVRRAPLLVALALLFTGALYLYETVSLEQALLWCVGALLGITLYHASFGFTFAWRVFAADRRADGIRAQMLMLAVGVILFFPFLAEGELAGNAVRGNSAPLGVSVVFGA